MTRPGYLGRHERPGLAVTVVAWVLITGGLIALVCVTTNRPGPPTPEPTRKAASDPSVAAEHRTQHAARGSRSKTRLPVATKNPRKATPPAKRTTPARVKVTKPNVRRGHNWDAVARCEASDGKGGVNWAANTGNGFYGGLQWMLDTWQRAGGAKYAAMPHHATREQQIAVAESWLSRTSWQTQWPRCGVHL